MRENKQQLGTEAMDGRRRVVIEHVRPSLDGGTFAIKRTVGERITVEAAVYSDGHDAIRAVLLHRKEDDGEWSEVPMTPLVNDRWSAEFEVTEIGRHRYTVQAWVDEFQTWRRDMSKRLKAGEAYPVDFLIGARLIEQRASSASAGDADRLHAFSQRLSRDDQGLDRLADAAMDDELLALMLRYPARRFAETCPVEFAVVVDTDRARFGAWYEFFPRSCAPEPGQHGNLRDCLTQLDYIASMGFDVAYLPPIHPIGRTNRKGRNNSTECGADDVGSPWAIGAEEGGHKSIHPDLGTLEDFRTLVRQARARGVEIALDIALQCSPDHPYVREHPEWFRVRPDGSVQYAENPPKRYQDIYPFDFECEKWRELWEELKSIFEFWLEQGVRIFRVDNPHTKPFRFWEWLIADIKAAYPEVIFLSEAFTRPKVMYRLAKLGFTQSYTYFAWRNTRQEIVDYFTELTRGDVAEFLRPNLWPNTPDILTEFLQFGGRPAFVIRLVLAATLGASYGIYGPAFELAEAFPREPGSEEYLDSEKYQVRHWDRDRGDSLRRLIGRINRIRNANEAFQSNRSLRFHATDNDQLICYSKHSDSLANTVLVVVNLDPYHTQGGWLDLDAGAIGLDLGRPYQAHDLLTDARYLWHGARNYVELKPGVIPASIFLLRRRVRTERDFDYFL